MLASVQEVAAVVTQPDKPAGRGLKLTDSPVKIKASELGIPVYQPQSLKDFEPDFKNIDPQLSVVVAYGKIIPEFILGHRKGAVNTHASLLPKYRGAAPIQRAIMNDEPETGITIQKMVPELDAGDIISTKKVTIDKEDTTGSLRNKLSVIAADLLVETVDGLDGLKGVRQDESLVTWAPKVSKEETVIKWEEPHTKIFNLIRAMNPAPGAQATLNGQSIKIWSSSLNETPGKPGQVIELSKKSFVIGCGVGSLSLEIVQVSGKNKVKGFEYARNSGIKEGDALI